MTFHDLDSYLGQKAIQLNQEGIRIAVLINSLIKYNNYPINSIHRNVFKHTDENAEKIGKIIGATYRDLVIDNLQDSFGFVQETIEKCKITERECLEPLMFCCFNLSNQYLAKKKKQNKDEEKFTELADILRSKSCEAIGYWNKILEKKISTKDIQGALSKEIGVASTNETEKILKEIGGIDGYNALGYGQKKPVVDKIAKKLKLKDNRQVYNILNKLRSTKQKD